VNVPTEPGPHWWRAGPDRPWLIAYVEDGVREFRVWEEYPGHAGEWVLYNIQGMGWGEWGERIPDNPRLKAMKELAAIDHVYCDGSDYERNHCLACGAEDEWCHVRTQPAGRKVFGWKLTHTPDCQWLRAQPPKEAPDA
jgi:hypothetical protein